MFVRPETIDRPTHERPSNKTFFSLCDVCITNCLASTIFLSIVILIPVRFPSTGRTEFEHIRQQSCCERWIILPSTYFFKHDLSMQQERHFCPNFPLNVNQFIEFSLKILENTLRQDNNLYRTSHLRIIRSKIYVSS